MTEIQRKSIVVRVSARFESARVRVIGSRLYELFLFNFFFPINFTRCKVDNYAFDYQIAILKLAEKPFYGVG